MFGYFWLNYIWKIDFLIFRWDQRKKSYRCHRAAHRNEPWQHLYFHQGHITDLMAPYVTEKKQERSTLDIEGNIPFLGDINEHFQTLACFTVMWKLSSLSSWWEKRNSPPHISLLNIETDCVLWLMLMLPATTGESDLWCYRLRLAMLTLFSFRTAGHGEHWSRHSS